MILIRCYVSVMWAPEPTNTTTAAPPVTAAPVVTNGTCSCGKRNVATRIVGGEYTETNEYPWQVALVSSGRSHPWCGGTLISSRHILTAAHCTAGESPSSMAVLLGEHRISDDKFDRRSLSAITDHPKYKRKTLDNDFSILTLSEPVTFTDKISPACLPGNGSQDYIGMKAIVSGWGTTSSGGNQPNKLKDVEVTVQSNDQCNQAYGGEITR